MRLHPSTCLILAGSWIASCSLINAPDDVVPQGTAGSSPGGGSGGSDVGNAGDGGDVGTSGGTGNEGGSLPIAGDGGGGEAGSGGDGTGNGGEAGSGGDGTGPAGGLIVIGGLVGPTTRVLSVLSAKTGAEIIRQTLPVAAVAYDEAPGKDVWFIFKASKFPADPAGTADLEVRTFDHAAGQWSTIGTATALPPPQPDQFVVLNDRLVYLSHRVINGAVPSALTVLDTSDVTNVSELVTRIAPAGESYVGVVGDRGSDVDAEAVGGRLRLMVSSECPVIANDCKLSALQVTVAGNLTDGPSVAIDRFIGKPRFAKARTEDKLYAVMRSTTPSNRVVIKAYPASLTAPTVSTVTGFVGNDVGGFDLIECATAGVLTDVAGSQMIAFNLKSGLQKVQPLGHPGAPVYAEPFEQSAIALDSDAAVEATPDLRSYEVSPAAGNNVVVNVRTNWVAPADLLPQTGATRRGATAACP